VEQLGLLAFVLLVVLPQLVADDRRVLVIRAHAHELLVVLGGLLPVAHHRVAAPQIHLRLGRARIGGERLLEERRCLRRLLLLEEILAGLDVGRGVLRIRRGGSCCGLRGLLRRRCRRDPGLLLLRLALLLLFGLPLLLLVGR